MRWAQQKCKFLDKQSERAFCVYERENIGWIKGAKAKRWPHAMKKRKGAESKRNNSLDKVHEGMRLMIVCCVSCQ